MLEGPDRVLGIHGHMNMLLFLFWSSFVIALSGAMIPGPVLTATVSEVMKRGFIAGPLIVLGHGLLEIVLLVMLVGGMGDWLLLPQTRSILGYVGGAILMVMGAHMIFTARSAAVQAQETTASAPPPLHGPVLAGMLTTLSNPYFYIWWATIGLGYAAFSLEQGRLGLAVFFSGHILADLAWYALIAFGVASGRRVCPPPVYRLILSACGLVLIGLGFWFVRYGAVTAGLLT